jgi:REP element-mobilizing transposase RayT
MQGLHLTSVARRVPAPAFAAAALWSKSYLVASVGRVSEAMIRRYIAEQTTRPQKGKP